MFTEVAQLEASEITAARLGGPATLKHVWCEQEQAMLATDQLIPEDPAKAQSLRRELAEAYQAHRTDPQTATVLWRCPICWDPLLLAGRPSGEGFYIRHRKNPDFACPNKNGGPLSLEQWNALRFNGQKESLRHIRLKERIRKMLDAWPGADSIQVEPTVRGVDKLTWKRPDILATIMGQEVAFEIQLSSTYLDVIVSRELFYRERGVTVFWVFDRFTHEGHRLYEKDIYYQHNANAFEASDEALAASRDTGIPHFTCHYLDPALSDDGGIRSTWKKSTVPITEITLCPDTFRVYWFDFDSKIIELTALQSLSGYLDQLRQVIRIDQSASSRQAEVKELVDQIYLAAGIKDPVPSPDTGAVRMLEVIISAQDGEFVGELSASGNANWPFWANTMFEHYSDFAKAFMRITQHYGMATTFTHRAPWQKKKMRVAEKRRRGQEAERIEWWPLFAMLAPECHWNK
ncbi:hypothetical protein EZI54_06975 [Marinobacter halodurans]|uniref:DUF6035 domain-containing protein n=1 Tax=Marinobacter halodurans TaxID=2528979 RepID=A0ABY1ZM55_9GAMM|nr:DUF6035 family protein [Marinobacter halodurans]TBW57393.1 hypothetical protein EZI54_06975 [Marinobacter halodurans]